MKTVVFTALLLFLCGCASLQPPEGPDTLPQLIYQAPLPPWPYSSFIQGINLELMLRIASNGSVQKALLLTSSGSSAWDSLAIATIRQWRFSPARMGTQPIASWIQQKVRVYFEPPAPMVISELACEDHGLIDSLYALLATGVPFDSLARRYSVFASREKGGFLGEVDLRSFPTHVRRQLANLRVGGITKPLALGQNVVIYKRLGRVQ